MLFAGTIGRMNTTLLDHGVVKRPTKTADCIVTNLRHKKAPPEIVRIQKRYQMETTDTNSQILLPRHRNLAKILLVKDFSAIV